MALFVVGLHGTAVHNARSQFSNPHNSYIKHV